MQSHVNLTNLKLLQYLADGFKVAEISEETGVNKRTIESRIMVLKEASLCKTIAHLVITYKRKQLIE